MHHTITDDELLEWLRTERWQQFAASSRADKQLDVLVNGGAFRVVSRGIEVYRGQNASDAVRAYNEAR